MTLTTAADTPGGRHVPSKSLLREHFSGVDVTWLSTPELTGSRQLLAVEAVMEPGSSDDTHRHPNQEKFFWLLEGRLSAGVGDESYELRAGDILFVPADAVHRIVNTSDQDARVVAVTSPCIGDTGRELLLVDDAAAGEGE